jgi:hypothetical protein
MLERLQKQMNDLMLTMKDVRFTSAEDARRNRNHLDGDD